MEIKDCIHDSTKEVLTTIKKHTESANSEIKLTIKDAEMTLNKTFHDGTSKIMSAIESLHGHVNALTKNVPISGENVTKCHNADPYNDVCATPVSAGNSPQTIGADDTLSAGQIKRERSSSLNEMNSEDQTTQPKRLRSDEESDDNKDSNDYNEYASENGGSDIDEDDLPEKHKRIYAPHDYQKELAEKALLGQNTIICAETGTGKTWVALYIIDKHISQTSKGTRKVAFMARTSALIKQQYNLFRKYLPDCKTKLLTKDDKESRNVDAFISMQDIICFTPQILINALDSGNVQSLSKFSLLVFDECHNTRGDEPYAMLARKYLIEKQMHTVDGQTQLPQIVGLTASIGVGRSSTVDEAVDNILRVCALLDVIPPISTVVRSRESLKKWVITPKEGKIEDRYISYKFH
ncbi:antiviral innate immune response receptor RIG-I-like [Dreissena polymorpha]|uniref:Helicase ATP-binding domain-containing protein n=1 Tax=Dreissena polymorpha TaxID=45954 RepID=A0A9D4GJR8_DREPO|nr:antiviral innate immune response receptor RIG-I-like [Dreissena polymorpha]KAH3816689.1 hypothetical protein DPMN_118210 [Dreissena polymorpha]